MLAHTNQISRTMRLLFLFLLVISCSFSSAQSPWVQQNSGTMENLKALHFTGPMDGYVVGDNGTALRTSDGGAVWTQMNGLPGMDLSSVAFTHPDTGYILPDFGSIYITHDGGTNWFADSTQFQSLCYWNRVRADGDGLLYLFYEGCFGNQEIFTWDPATGDTTFLSIYSRYDFGENAQDIDFPEAGTAVIVGDSGMLIRTTDGGDTWTSLPGLDTNQNFKVIDFVDADTGYAMTHDLFLPLWMTTDGGQTWAVDSSWVSTFFYPEFNDMEFWPGNLAYLAGATTDMGIVFRRDYWGGSWVHPSVLHAVDLVADSLCWVVGDTGYIARLGDPLLSSEEPLSDFDPPTLFPNPFTDQLSIQWANAWPGNLDFALYDLHGRKLVERSLLVNGVVMEMGELPRGMYLAQLKHGERSWSFKLLKE